MLAAPAAAEELGAVIAAATRWVLQKAVQAIPAIIALATSGDENKDDKHRGRIQIQNNTDLKQV